MATKLAAAIALLWCVNGFSQPSTCLVHGVIYDHQGSGWANQRVTVSKVTKNGVLIYLGPLHYATDDTGYVAFNIVRGAQAYIQAPVAGFNVPGGVLVNIPDSADCELSSLQQASTIASTNAGFIYIAENDGSPSYQVTGNDDTLKVSGASLSQPSARTVLLTVTGGGGGGSVTVEEADGTPSVSSVATIQFDQADGFMVTDETGGQVQVDLVNVPLARLAEDVIAEAELDTESELEGQLTDVTDVFTDNDGALSDDDLSDNNVGDLSDVTITSAAAAHLLVRNAGNTAWENVALSGDGVITAAGALTISDDSHSHTDATIANDLTLGTVSGAVDAGSATSLEVPNGATPTTDAFGEIAGDNNAWAASRGAVQFFDGTASTYLVGTLSSDTPSNGQVPKWNTGGTITWEDDATTGLTVRETDLSPSVSSVTTLEFLNGSGFSVADQGGGVARVSSSAMLQAGGTFTGTPKLADDVDLSFGTNLDWNVQYDESVDDQLLIQTAKTSAIATDDPMLQVLVDTGGSGMTANQQVLGVAKGSQASNTDLFYVDEDGDGYFAGNVSFVDSKSFVITDPATSSDYPIWKVPAAVTILSIDVLAEGGTNVVGGLDEADGNGDSATAIDSDITASSGTNASDDGTLTNPTLDAGDYLLWHTTSVSGSVTSVTITFTYRLTP